MGAISESVISLLSHSLGNMETWKVWMFLLEWQVKVQDFVNKDGEEVFA